MIPHAHIATAMLRDSIVARMLEDIEIERGIESGIEIGTGIEVDTLGLEMIKAEGREVEVRDRRRGCRIGRGSFTDRRIGDRTLVELLGGLLTGTLRRG
jgi:hypothetical protein